MGGRGGRQQMACHTVRAVGWHPEEEEEGGEGRMGGGGWVGWWRWGAGGGYRDWRGTAPKVPAGIRREGEGERDRGEGLLVGDRLVDRQTGRNPQTLRLELKRGLGAGFRC